MIVVEKQITYDTFEQTHWVLFVHSTGFWSLIWFVILSWVMLSFVFYTLWCWNLGQLLLFPPSFVNFGVMLSFVFYTLWCSNRGQLLHFSPNFVNTTCKKCVSWFILIITFNYILAGGILAWLILLYSSPVHCYCINLLTMWSTCWSPWVIWSYASYHCAVDIFIIALYWLYYWSDLVYSVTFSFVCISPDVQPLL